MITFSDNTLELNGDKFTLQYPIKEAFEVDDKIIVLFDPDSNFGKQGQFHNLIALSNNGTQIWAADLPTDKRSDVYYRIVSKTPLKADSFCSYECVIDPQSGKIVSKIFFK